MLVADGQDRDHDRDADERASYAPQKSPEKDGEQHHEWRHGKNAACYPRLEVAADEELDEVQTTEYQDRALPGFELSDGEQCRQNRCDQRADEGDIVEREGDDAPFLRKWESAKRDESSHEHACDHAHQ
jgi:hypothetical protein